MYNHACYILYIIVNTSDVVLRQLPCVNAVFAGSPLPHPQAFCLVLASASTFAPRICLEMITLTLMISLVGLLEIHYLLNSNLFLNGEA